MQKTFNKIVLEHFRYLVSDYDFRVGQAWQKDPDFRLEGFVDYISPTTFVSIADGWFDVEVSFGRVMDDRKFAVSVGMVHEYLSLSPEQRETVCSQNPWKKQEARMLIASQRLQYEKHEFTNDAEETKYQVIEQARWLRQNADPFLRGDLSLWLAIHEYKLARMIGEVRQSWKREVRGRFVGLSPDRKAMYVREHMFQEEVDYLARLKAEK